MAFLTLCPIPRFGRSGELRLRPLRVSDASSLFTALGDAALLKTLGLSRSPSSRLSAWWWFRRAHLLSYCIEAASGTAGLLGLSSLVPCQSAELSLVIFPAYQRMGYGIRVVKLITALLKKHRSLGRLTVSVRRDNAGIVSFWEKAGFREEGRGTGDIMKMALNLSEER